MFYGWKLASIGSFGNFMLQGSALYAMNAFMEPLADLHGWSRSGMNMAMGFAAFCGAASAPCIIMLAAKHSLRIMMTLGALLGGLALLSLGYVQELWAFALLSALVWIAGQACGGSGATLLMEQWFDRNANRVFAFVAAGTSFSGVILPFFALFLLECVGVQWAYTWLGGIVILFAPICYILIRDTPKELGLLVDGELATSKEDANKKPVVSTGLPMSMHELIRNPSVWIIGCSVGMVVMVTVGVVSQLKPRFVDVGFDSRTAMAWMSATALCATFGKIVWGRICDLVTPLKALKLVILCNALSLSLIFLPQSAGSASAFAILYGLCYGGVWAVVPAAITYVFGRNNFLLVYQILSVCILLKALGYPIIGLSYGLTGSYDMGYGIFVLTLLGAFCLSLLLKEKSAVGHAS